MFFVGGERIAPIHAIPVSVFTKHTTALVPAHLPSLFAKSQAVTVTQVTQQDPCAEGRWSMKQLSQLQSLLSDHRDKLPLLKTHSSGTAQPAVACSPMQVPLLEYIKPEEKCLWGVLAWESLSTQEWWREVDHTSLVVCNPTIVLSL